MNWEEMVTVCCCDIAGQVRGKAMALSNLEIRRGRGVGWTPTNIMITAHGPIGDTPWGPFGDLMIKPDLDTRVRADYDDERPPLNFVLGDIEHTDGRPWECCPRDFLRRGLSALEAEFGLHIKAAFEHELHYDGSEERPNSSYALDAVRRQGAFGEMLFKALRSNNVEPDTFMAEYGPSQYEITVAPAHGIRAADDAVILRELARTTAERLGQRASFTPILRPDSVGNGVHMHFSLEDRDGHPVSHDPSRPHHVSEQAGAFLAGIVQKLPALCALTAPSVVSYLRLVPHRWSAAFTNLGLHDREAAVRICPVFLTSEVAPQDQFNFEYRAADAAASPYIAFGALVWAGVLGLRQGLAMPEPTDTDLTELSEADRAERGLRELPHSLGEALDSLEADADLAEAMGPVFMDAYLRHKRFEITLFDGQDLDEQCRRYYLAY